MNINSLTSAKFSSAAKTSFSQAPSGAPDSAALPFSSRKQAERYKEQGNLCAQNGDKDGAITYYLRSIEQDSSYLDSYYNLAKVYYEKGDVNSSINYYNQILQQDSTDPEAMVDLGVIYKELGNYKQATQLLNQAVMIDPMNDLARRNLLETQNLALAQVNPSLAAMQKAYQEQTNLQAAYNMVATYLPPEIMNNIKDVGLKFGETAKMGGDANIAQYANATKDITVTDKYIWAAPQLIGSYLAHEYIHAYDKDSYSSIKEEQDAYREAAKFWITYAGGLKDPEMDYVKELYLQSPYSLDSKVEEVYRTKDPTLPLASPNHGMLAAAVDLRYKINQAASKFNSMLNGGPELKSIGILHDFKLRKDVYK